MDRIPNIGCISTTGLITLAGWLQGEYRRFLSQIGEKLVRRLLRRSRSKIPMLYVWMGLQEPRSDHLKTHITKKGHDWHKKLTQQTDHKDVMYDKFKSTQDHKPKVHWGDKEVDNCYRFEYLRSIQQVDGDQGPDTKSRIHMTKARTGQLRHILSSTDLNLDLRLRLYISTWCSALVYDSEAWILDEVTCRKINGTNSYMFSHITDNSHKHETTLTPQPSTWLNGSDPGDWDQTCHSKVFWV